MGLTTYPAEIATSGTLHFVVALVDENGELYEDDPFGAIAVAMYRNGEMFTPSSVIPNQRAASQVYDVAIAYTGLTAGDYVTIEPFVEIVEGQTIKLASGVARVATPVDLTTVTDAIDTLRGADSDTLKTLSDEIAAAVVSIRGADSDTLKTLSDQLDSAISTLAGVFEDADVSALVSAIIAAVETSLDGADVSVQQIAARVRVELATELQRIDVPMSTRSSHSAADVKTAVEAGGSSLAQALAAAVAIQAKSDQLAFTSGKVNAQVKSIDTDAITPAAVKNFRLRDVAADEHTDLVWEETP